MKKFAILSVLFALLGGIVLAGCGGGGEDADNNTVPPKVEKSSKEKDTE